MNAVASRNIKFVGHSDLGGRGDGVQVMVHRGYAYIGHGYSNGITTVDVRDPKNPKVVDFIACPPGTRAFHLQTHEDLLLAVNAPSVWTMQEFQTEKSYFSGSPADKLKDQSRFTAGIRVYDISKPEKPPRSASCRRTGSDRTASGTSAAATPTRRSISPISPTTSSRSSTCPTRASPRSSGASGFPACGAAAARRRPGAKASATRFTTRWSPATSRMRPGATAASRCSTSPTRQSPRCWPIATWIRPSAAARIRRLPLPDRNLLVLGEEPTFANCSEGLRYIWMFDVREPSNPVSIATFPQPADADYCAKGGSFGPHNLHENRPGAFQSSRLIFATYYNAGVRAYDIENPFRPREIAYYVPPNPTRMLDPRPNRPQVIQSCDCYVDRNGLMYLTDPNAGLNILQFDGMPGR